MPGEWIISRVCEEFNCLPSQALRENAEVVFTIMDLRSYARAKALIEHKDTSDETLQRAGLPDFLIESVMANKERALNGP